MYRRINYNVSFYSAKVEVFTQRSENHVQRGHFVFRKKRSASENNLKCRMPATERCFVYSWASFPFKEEFSPQNSAIWASERVISFWKGLCTVPGSLHGVQPPPGHPQTPRLHQQFLQQVEHRRHYLEAAVLRDSDKALEPV